MSIRLLRKAAPTLASFSAEEGHLAAAVAAVLLSAAAVAAARRAYCWPGTDDLPLQKKIKIIISVIK